MADRQETVEEQFETALALKPEDRCAYLDEVGKSDPAVRQLVEELDPAHIEAKSDNGRGLANIMSSRKARLWDIYVARWQARTEHQQDGMLAAFMDYFADCYDRGESDVRESFRAVKNRIAGDESGSSPA